MEQTLTDLKLKDLIEICKKNKNYKRISVVLFILIGNKLDEIGINLGLRPRDKDKSEMIFEYVNLINSIFEKNLKFKIIKEEITLIMKEIELSFIKNRGEIPMDFIKAAIDIYYELRKIDVPNVFEKYNLDLADTFPEYSIYSLLNPLFKGDDNFQEDKMKFLLKNNIETQEFILQKDLSKRYDKKKFEKVLHYEKLKKSIDNNRNGKTIVKGALKDNIKYQKLKSEIPGYWLLGVFLLFMMLGLTITIQTTFNPSSALALGPLILGFFGAGCMIFLIYWNSYHNEED